MSCEVAVCRESDVAISTDELTLVFKDIFSRLASGVCVVALWRGGSTSRVYGNFSHLGIT